MNNFFAFSSFITISMTRVFFVIGLIAALSWKFIDDPLLAICAIIVWRVILEITVAFTRIAQDMTKLVEMKSNAAE